MNGRQLIHSILGSLALVACLLTMLTFATPAKAAGEFELNDTRETAYGPLEGGKSYTATFETGNDVDWYVFYIKTYSQMDFSATMVKSCEDYARISLYDKDGNYERSFETGKVNETTHLLQTMNPGRYYFEVEHHYSCTGDRYSFRIDPAASITTSRECGEAIVARDSVGPELTAVNEELAKNGEALATTAQAVHEAKRQLRRASKKAQRLKQIKQPGKRRHVRSKLRQTRSAVQSARRQLDKAKAERRPVWKERRDLEAIAGQHQQTIASAEGQMATYC